MLSERLKTTLHQKDPVQFCLDTLGTTLHRSKLYAMLLDKLQITWHKKKSCAILSQYSRDNFAQVKTLCNYIREAPSNNA